MVNLHRTLQVQIKTITTIWILKIRLTLALVVQMNLFVQYFHWKIQKCNHLGPLRKQKEVLKWVYIMQRVIDHKTLCKYIRKKITTGCMHYKLLLTLLKVSRIMDIV